MGREVVGSEEDEQFDRMVQLAGLELSFPPDIPAVKIVTE